MKKLYKYLSIAVQAIFLTGLASCSQEALLETPEEVESGNIILPNQITAVMPQPETRTAYSEVSGVLHTQWAENDQIAITPVCMVEYTTLYTVDPSTASGSSATFKKTSGGTSNTTNVSTNIWGVYYPGNSIRSDIEFMNFTYSGQVQKASDPMGHMGKYHAMRQVLTSSSYGTFPAEKAISFANSDQSSCLKFNLSGMTFKNPSKISVSYIENGFISPVFYENNSLNSYYYDGNSSYNGSLSTAELSMGLEGYGNVSSLTAYMMMSNQDVTLYGGGYLLIKVTCEDATYYTKVKVGSADITLTGGYYHSITAAGGWQEDLNIDDTDYAFDGEVVTLQEATRGNGIDLVIMGDGFTAEDFTGGEESYYTSIMKQAFHEFFSVEPLTYYQDYFNVYYVKAVSPQGYGDSQILQNGATGNGTRTKFSTVFSSGSTQIRGNNDLINEYAKLALGANANERIKNATVVVMCNIACHAGTCWNSWSGEVGNFDYGMANAVCFCPLGKNDENRRQLMHHEICGHGFGKLADEYYGTSYPTTTYYWNQINTYHGYGLFRNTDKYVTASNASETYPQTTQATVYWHDLFGTVNQYESAAVESLGIFEGGYTYVRNFCRPTYDGAQSIMNHNTGQFNAISRRQIMYRVLSLAGEYTGKIWGTTQELNNFLEWDRTYYLPKKNSSSTGSQTAPMAPEIYPLDPPVMVQGEWIDGHFIPAE